MKDAINDLNGIKALATFADGTSETISINKLTKLGGTVIKGTALDITDLAATSGVYSYVKQGSTYEITQLKDANPTANSWSTAPAAAGNYDDGATVSPNTYTIKKGLNAIQFNNGLTTQNIVSLNNSTIFVDVEGGVIYTGYANVPTMTDISFYVVYNKQLNADVVFITDGADNSTSDSYFMILDGTPVTSKKAADGTMYYEYKASVNGEEKTLTMKGINKDNAGNLFAKYGLYKIETITPNDEITEASKVTRFSTTFNASGSRATEKTSGTIRIANDADIAQCGNNLVSGLGQDIYAYNNDTVFMNVELKADGSVSKVSRSSANAINTTNDDIPGYSNVYVVTVDDKDARTPVATLVYVVTPHESTSGTPGTGTGTLGSVTVNADLTVTMDAVVNTADATVRAEMKQAIEQIAGKTVVRVDNGASGNDKSVFTFTCSDGTVYTGTVTYKHTITIDDTVHYLNAASGDTTSVPDITAFDLTAYTNARGYIYSTDGGSTWTYAAYGKLNATTSTLSSVKGSAVNLIVKTGYYSVSGQSGQYAYAKAGEDYTAPAKGSNHGTGLSVSSLSGVNFVAYGDKIPADKITGNFTLTANYVTVTYQGFSAAQNAVVDVVAYNSLGSAPAVGTVDAAVGSKGTGVVYVTGSGESYADYSGPLTGSSEQNVVVKAGYTKVTGFAATITDATAMTGVDVTWTVNGQAVTGNTYVKAGTVVNVVATVKGSGGGWTNPNTSGGTPSKITAKYNNSVDATAAFSTFSGLSATSGVGTFTAATNIAQGETFTITFTAKTAADAAVGAYTLTYTAGSN